MASCYVVIQPTVIQVTASASHTWVSGDPTNDPLAGNNVSNSSPTFNFTIPDGLTIEEVSIFASNW
jgi:hypothetical protein